VRLDLPYPEYWIPLLIGLGAGLVAVLVGKLALSRRQTSVKTQELEVKAKVDYDPFVQGSPSELRKTFRRDGNPTEVLVAFGPNKSRPGKGWVLDRSTGGLRMLVDQEFQQGAILSILPSSAPNMTPWTEIEVRSCRACPDGFELGCQFVKTPTWSVLLMFG
jgi:hypothetical protein